MRTYHQILLISLFIALLFGCLLGSIFHWDFYEQQEENRKLAEFPLLAETPITAWPEKFEAYFNDHFGFRNTFIRRHNRLLRKIGRDPRVLRSEDGWLFLNMSTIMMDYLGERQPSAKKLRTQLLHFEDRRDWLKQRDIDYLFILVPNKITIYPEHLPTNMRPLGRKTYRQTFNAQLEQILKPNYMDLTPSLKRMKNSAPLYFEKDSHWNSAGSYIAYTQIVEELQRRLPHLPNHITIPEMERSIVTHTGDLSRLMGSPDYYNEDTIQLIYPDSKKWTRTPQEHPIFLEKANTPIDGGKPLTIHNPNGKLDAFVFHDSFMLNGAMIDWLPSHFRNTTFIWRYSNATLLKSIVELYKPDIIIEQVVERHLVDEENGALLDPIGHISTK